MGSYMDLKITSSCARVVALFATIRFFTGMGSHVASKIASCCARVVTLRTTERLLTRMSKQVCPEATSRGAREAALIALERLFSSVFEPQTRRMSTGIVTLLIFVGFLACVLSECQLEHKYNHMGHS